jgi:hypothetical protein
VANARAKQKDAESESPGRVSAWTLDESIAVAVEGAHIAGIPGLWKPGEAVSPAAFGMGVSEFETLVEQLQLPLVKVYVDEAEARTSFERPETHLASAPLGIREAAPVEDSVEADALDEPVEIGDAVVDEVEED